KNKVAPPFREVTMDMIFGQGFSRLGTLIDLAVEKKIIKKSGAWYSYKDEKLGQGKENVKETLQSNPDVLEAIEQETRAAMGMNDDTPVTDFVRNAIPAEIMAQVTATGSPDGDEDDEDLGDED
ncbi:MAG TPA: hypothetical protein VEI97_06065, partial [bacterium]|nr:hypothetical protein [bacterium]